MTKIYCDAYGYDIDDSECENCIIRERTGFSIKKCPFSEHFKKLKDKKDFEEI